MRYFDLHCDTLIACVDGENKVKSNGLQLSLDRGSCFELWEQCFAVWFPENRSLSFQKKRFLDCVRLYSGLKRSNLRAHLTLENGVIAMLSELSPGVLRDVYGVTVMSLTWNGAGPLGDGCGVVGGGGLTSRGRELARETTESGIVLDVSHLSESGFFELLGLTDEPLIASHSNSHSVCPHRRNLTDEQIRLIGERGGIIGLCFYPEFVGEGDLFEGLYRHACHIMEVGGEACLAIGSDFDGAQMGERLKELSHVCRLRDYLSARGLGDEIAEKIFFRNADNFFNRVFNSENM